MPSRWWVPIPGLDPHFVRLEHLHAAVTRWFDSSAGEHHANGKPYAVSPLRPGDAGGVGVEIGILTDHAHHCFSKATARGPPFQPDPAVGPPAAQAQRHLG